LEQEFFCLGGLGSQGSKEKKVDLSFSERLLSVVFSTFCGQILFNDDLFYIIRHAWKPKHKIHVLTC
jgi:hypothetical protein